MTKRPSFSLVSIGGLFEFERDGLAKAMVMTTVMEMNMGWTGRILRSERAIERN